MSDREANLKKIANLKKRITELEHALRKIVQTAQAIGINQIDPNSNMAILLLSKRVQDALKMAGIKTISQLLEKRGPGLLKIKFIGRKGVEEIREALDHLGFSL